MEELEEKQFTLSVNAYIERPPVPPVDPERVKEQYFTAVDEVRECEDKLIRLLKEGGYIE